MPVYGVDIHAKYQAGISFTKLYQEGYRFAVMKLTEGTSISYLNSAKSWIPQIRQVGMVAGVYHWIGKGNGAGQAQYFYNAVKALGGPKGLLIQLDCEDDATETDVTNWVNEWKRLSGNYPFFIYSGYWWWKTRLWNGTKWTPYLWDSRYLSADTDTVSDNPVTFASRIPSDWWLPRYGGWKKTKILQFTSKGDAGSLGNNVDLNIFDGTMAELEALAGLEDDLPTAQEIADAVWAKQFPYPVDGRMQTTNAYLRYANYRAYGNAADIAALSTKVDGLLTVVNALAEALRVGGGDIDTAAVLAKLDGLVAQVNDLSTKLAAAETERDSLRQKLADALAGQ